MLSFGEPEPVIVSLEDRLEGRHYGRQTVSDEWQSVRRNADLYVGYFAGAGQSRVRPGMSASMPAPMPAQIAAPPSTYPTRAPGQPWLALFVLARGQSPKN